MTKQDVLVGSPSHKTGAKREKLGHPRYDYMPAKDTNESFARVATFGAEKYGDNNWKKGLPISQISGSLQRHLWSFMDCEDIDDDSQLEHLDHIVWNAIALRWTMTHKPACDDRFVKDWEG